MLITVLMQAVIDVGSNSVKYLINVEKISVPAGAKLIKSWTTGLGRNITSNGDLSASAISATGIALKEMRDEFLNFGIDFTQVLVLGTAALRRCRDPQPIADLVWKLFSQKLHIISGETEAHLSHLGAKFALTRSCPELDQSKVLFADIGGASTELSFMQSIERAPKLKSFTIGAALTHEQLGWSDAAISDSVWLQGLKRLESLFPLEQFNAFTEGKDFSCMVAVSGSLVAALAASQATAVGELGFEMSFESYKQLCDKVRKLNSKERHSDLNIEENRSDILCAGMLCALAPMIWNKIPKIFVTSAGLRHGALLHGIADH